MLPCTSHVDMGGARDGIYTQALPYCAWELQKEHSHATPMSPINVSTPDAESHEVWDKDGIRWESFAGEPVTNVILIQLCINTCDHHTAGRA